MFTFDDGLQDVLSRDRSWEPGEPWDQRGTSLATDSRDRPLEDHVNAEYVLRNFKVTVVQVSGVAQTAICTFTRAAKVHVELSIAFSAAGTAGFQILLFPTGLPLTKYTGPSGGAMGGFIYFRGGSTAPTSIIVGSLTWDGVTASLWTGGSNAGGTGFSPNFAIASGDELIANFDYLPKLT